LEVAGVEGRDELDQPSKRNRERRAITEEAVSGMKKRFIPAQRPAGSPALAGAEDAGHAEERERARGGFSDVDCAVARTPYPILWHKPM
jgi:hypothetical protein